MPRIPEETIQQVLSATDIVDLVGRYVKLRRTGSNYLGLCPFHTEKTPSFNVSPSRNTYHCFGCGAGGTAIRFVMEHDGLTFTEAVKRLADAAGIRIEEEVWDANAEKAAKLRSALMRAHKEIAAWYHQLLMKDAAGEPARTYLKSRGINAAVAKNWQLGYAPASGDALRRWAGQHKFSERLLIEAGILASSEGGTYPRFRHRLMFPICNENGEVIAFSGRLLDPDAKAAKYLNSPETPIFNKSKVLFGFHKTRRAMAKSSQAVVCEGQIDLITAFESGFENVVAPLGTAFTEHHARLLKRHADEVVLCFDSDSAGYKAAVRTFGVLAPTGLIVKVAALPPGEDPDTMIRGHGPEAFSQLIEGAQEFIDYQIERAGQNGGLTDMRDRVRFADQMAASIRLLENPVARETAIQRVAVRLGIPENTLRRVVGKRVPVSRTSDSTNPPAGDQSGQKLLSAQDKTAMLLCRLALAEPEVMNWLRTSQDPELLRDIAGTELLSLVWSSKFDPQDAALVSTFLAGLQPEEENAMSRLLTQPPPPGGLEEARHALEALQLIRLQSLIQRLQTQLKHPNLDPAQAATLQQEVVKLRKEYLDRLKRSPDTA